MLTTKMTKQDLKHQIVDNLDIFDEKKLFSIHQFISELIANDLIDSVTDDWTMKNINQQRIDEVITEYRKLHTNEN